MKGYFSVNRTFKSIFCGIGGFALTLAILIFGRNLIRGTSLEDGLRDFWNWAISAMSGFSCGYAWKINDEKKKASEQKDDDPKDDVPKDKFEE